MIVEESNFYHGVTEETRKHQNRITLFLCQAMDFDFFRVHRPLHERKKAREAQRKSPLRLW
jgi:hypothetical protein